MSKYKQSQQPDFRMDVILLTQDIPEHWFLQGLFHRIQDKRSTRINIDKARKEYLLNCYTAFVHDFSNGSKLIRLHFEKQHESDSKSFEIMLQEWDEMGIGYMIY